MDNASLKLILESNLINFLALLVLIGYFMVKFLPDSTKKRKEELQQQIDNATKARQEAEAKLEQLEQEIANAKKEADVIVQEAKSNAESIKKQIHEDAKQEIFRLYNNAEKDIELQKSLAIEQIKAEIAKLSLTEIETRLAEKKNEINGLTQQNLSQNLEKIFS